MRVTALAVAVVLFLVGIRFSLSAF
jgi:hypothetical protein